MSDGHERSADAARSWLPVPADCGFPIQNLPYGVFERAGSAPRVGVAIGEHILDLAGIAETGLLDAELPDATRLFEAPSLNALLAAGRPTWTALRAALTRLLDEVTSDLRDHPLRERLLTSQADARMLLPFDVSDHADFYGSIEHATTMGRLYRPTDPDPLLAQFRHLPIGGYRRARGVLPSGTPIVRPAGLKRAPDGGVPVFGVCEQMDYEVELAFVTGGATGPGEPIPIERADEHIFGFVVLNDWSARDIQRYEAVPFGPFASKFAASVSPWVVPLDALAPWRVPGPPQEPPVAEYLRSEEPWNLQLRLETRLQTAGRRARSLPPVVVASTTSERLYWSAAQALAHLTVTGGPIAPGGLYGLGTISGWEPEEKGCLVERTRNGVEPIELGDGEQRTFLADDDEVSIRAWADPADAGADTRHRVSFGAVSGAIRAPATYQSIDLEEGTSHALLRTR
jgi:fumarylacetoacetase